ncbi:MAG: DUF484 family protein [Rhodobacteraceae bacterium]|nr:DUF484 family protein [Paracoccaceae bacterium]
MSGSAPIGPVADGASSPADALKRLPESARAAILADPDVVLTDPELMKALITPVETADRNVVDLRGALIQRLEQRLTQLNASHRDVVEAAVDNLAGMTQVHSAALAVLDAASFEDFLGVVSRDFVSILEVDAVRLCLAVEAPDGAALGDGVAVVSRAELDLLAPPPSAPQPSAAPGGTVVLRRRCGLDGRLFGVQAEEFGSVALVRLEFGPAILPGALAFGAADPERFHPEQGDVLLHFLGGVVERAMRDWMALRG